MRLTDDGRSHGQAEMPLPIILADDHQIVRQGLKVLLEREYFEVVGEASNGQEAVRLAGELSRTSRCSISRCRSSTDWTPPADSQVSPIPERSSDRPHRGSYVLESVRAGIKGYVVKTQAAEDLIRAIHEVSKGQIYLSPGSLGRW